MALFELLGEYQVESTTINKNHSKTQNLNYSMNPFNLFTSIFMLEMKLLKNR